jgi:hypothetical protein
LPLSVSRLPLWPAPGALGPHVASCFSVIGVESILESGWSGVFFRQQGIAQRLLLRCQVANCFRPIGHDAESISKIGGEALGIEIEKHISPDFSTISIREKARHCKIEQRLKTASALRDVDIAPAVSALLKAFVGERKSGFLFKSRKGKPIGPSNVVRRHLHPALEKLGTSIRTPEPTRRGITRFVASEIAISGIAQPGPKGFTNIG